ncbi:MAG: translocation/assembly module TamB domain-containing protein [Myxococcota bacterium]
MARLHRGHHPARRRRDRRAGQLAPPARHRRPRRGLRAAAARRLRPRRRHAAAPRPGAHRPPGRGPARRAAAGRAPLYADFDVDIDVDLNRNLELSMAVPFVDDLGEVGAALSSADLSARLGGQLHVEMANQQPTLVGEVDVVEGKVRVLRSSLALEESTISFAGGDPYADASLDLSGVMSVEGGDLELSIRGPLAAPTFSTRSDAFPDEAEQWTILLTGQSPEELTSGQAQGAAQALAGLFVNSLLGGQSLGTLSVEPDNSVRLGVPVTPKLYATSTFAPFAQLDENALSLELEWSLGRRMVWSAGVGDQVQWGDLFWEIRLTSRARREAAALARRGRLGRAAQPPGVGTFSGFPQ